MKSHKIDDGPSSYGGFWQLTRLPINPEAHAFLTDQGAAVLIKQIEADFDDGDAENGPGTWGYPGYDHYQDGSHDIYIEWCGVMFVSEIEPDDPWPFAPNGWSGF